MFKKGMALMVCLVMVLTSSVFAGDKKISYQGKLCDASGKPLDTTGGSPITVTFRLYNVAIGGVALWSENKGVSFSQGLFNVTLGQIVSLDGLPFSEQYYLGIQVAGDAEMTPRQAINASGYALGSLGDFNVKGKVGIGTTAPNGLLSLGKTVGKNKLLVYDGGSSGVYAGFAIDKPADNDFTMYTHCYGNLKFGTMSKDFSTITPWMTIVGSGNVGIGTTNPATKLEVYNGVVTIATPGRGSGLTLTGDRPGFFINNTYDNYFVQMLNANNGFVVYTGKSGANYGALTIKPLSDTDANVGIGITNPTEKLEVNGNIKLTQASSKADLFNQIIPAGTIYTFACNPPAGYRLLECDGSAISRSTYAELFATMGITHGRGDGSTTFNIPDYRGRFLRGVDGAAGRDPDKAGRSAMNAGGNTANAVGSVELDAMQGHWHGFWAYTVNDPKPAGGTSYAGDMSASSPQADKVRDAVTDGSHGSPRISSETRPNNAYVKYYIKY